VNGSWKLIMFSSDWFYPLRIYSRMERNFIRSQHLTEWMPFRDSIYNAASGEAHAYFKWWLKEQQMERAENWIWLMNNLRYFIGIAPSGVKIILIALLCANLWDQFKTRFEYFTRWIWAARICVTLLLKIWNFECFSPCKIFTGFYI